MEPLFVAASPSSKAALFSVGECGCCLERTSYLHQLEGARLEHAGILAIERYRDREVMSSIWPG